MNPEYALESLQKKTEEKPLPQFSLELSVLNDFCTRIKGQPQGKVTRSPQSKKISFMHQILDGLLKATFEDDFYDRFDFFFRDEIVYVFQGKKFKHHVIYSTKTKNYFLLKDGIYRIFKFVGLMDTPPTTFQKEDSLQKVQEQQ